MIDMQRNPVYEFHSQPNRNDSVKSEYDYPITSASTSTQQKQSLSHPKNSRPSLNKTRVFSILAFLALILSLSALVGTIISFILIFEQPRQRNVLKCEQPSPPNNGEISVAPGPNSLSGGLGSVATYSCHPGYVLVGQTTRICVDTNGGTVTTGTWSGTTSSCQELEVITCQPLTQPSNGAVTISSGTHGVTLGRGATATYSCDTGYGLVGQATRTCVVTNGGSTGTWSGSQPTCQVITCLRLSAPNNGIVMISTASQLLSVGTTATYSCDPGYVLFGETTRICEDTNNTATGVWSGNDPECTFPTFLNDCNGTNCRYQQLMCPDDKNCVVDCSDSRPYACFQTGLVCPSRGGDCTLNCDDEYACVQGNMTCSQGDCTVNCESDYTCLNSVTECSGDNCLLNCNRRESCSNSIVYCSSGNCTLNCSQNRACSYLNAQCSGENCLINCDHHLYSCQHSNIECTSGNCEINCRSYYSCEYSTVSCPPHGLCTVNCLADQACSRVQFTCPAGGHCVYHFDGINLDYGNNIGRYAVVTCQENSTCDIHCTGSSDKGQNSCQSSRITCPTDSGDCAITCSGYYSCRYATIRTGYVNGLNCTGRYSCQHTNIICPANNTCTINCDGQYSCNDATVICPTGDYSCNILCTDPLSCSNLSITNTHNVYLQCCGGLSCGGTGVTPASTDCPYIQ